MTRPKVTWEIIAKSSYGAFCASRDYTSNVGLLRPWDLLSQGEKVAWQCAVRQAVAVADGSQAGSEASWRGWSPPVGNQTEWDGD